MSTDLQAFGKRLRQYREERGLTQAELERQLPVSEGLVSRWERAYQGQGRLWKPDRQMLLRLLQLFAEILDAAEAHTFALQAGYKLTPSEIHSLFPLSQQDFPTGRLPDLSHSGLRVSGPPPPTTQALFVGRAQELARLHGYLDQALGAQGSVAFVNGAAGSGKSSLMRLFAQKALAEHPELLVLDSSCSAYGGYGTPYMPFREIANVLLGNATTQWATGSIRHSQQRRLQSMAPSILQLFANHCRHLVETFIPAAVLADQARALQLSHAISDEQLHAYLSLFEAKPDGGRSRPLDQHNLFEEYTKLLHLLSQQQPLLILIDDLHWADAASVSLLFHLARSLQGKPILILGTYRSSDIAFVQRAFDHQGSAHPLASVIHEMQRVYGSILVDLDHSPGASFVDAYLDSEPNRLDSAFRARLLAHTRGHALFTVEMVRGMQERGEIVRNAEMLWVEGEIQWEKVPARIEGLIAELLDRIPTPLRELLEVASIQGESFSAEVIAQVVGLDEQQVLRYLSVELGRSHHLVVEEGVQRIGTQRLSQFRFRHLLFQSYLYHSLGKVARAYHHERVGLMLEAICEGESEPFTEQLARHFQEANLLDKAAHYLLLAGKRALRLAAHEESIQRLRAGLALLEQLSPTARELTARERTARERTELELLVTLGTSLIATKGYGFAEVEEVYTRALKLAIQSDDTAQRAAILFNLWIFNRGRSNNTNATELAQQLMELAQQTQETGLLLEAHHALWTNSLYVGDYSAAHLHAKAGITLYRAQEHHPLTFQYGGHDPGVCCHIFGAYALWYLGYPDQALQRIQAGIILARSLGHAYSLGMVLTLGAELLMLRRESEAALALLQEARTLAEKHSFANWLELNAIFRGWALAEVGDAERGLAEILQGIEASRAIVGEAAALPCVAQLASAYGKANQPEKGLALLDAALAVEDKNKLRHWDQWQSELYRLQGELRWMQIKGIGTVGDPMQSEALQSETEQRVEESYWQAIELARRQEAKMPELRAVVSLCHLWRKQGRLRVAHALLSHTYGWFTEGFATQDLQEAAALLELLAEAVASEGRE